MQVNKILVLCPIGLGNFIMATPALQLLSRQFEAKNLVFLALRKGIAEMAEASGYFGEVLCWDPDRESKFKGLLLLNGLRKRKIDISLSLFPSGNWRFPFFAFASGAKQRLGLIYQHQPWAKRFQTQSLKPNSDLHDTDQNLRFIEWAFQIIESNSSNNLMQISRVSLTFPIAPKTPKAGLPSVNYLVCHPGSSVERGMKEKRLPPRQFAKIIDLLYEKFGIKSVLIGDKTEADLRSEVASKCKTAAILDLPTQSLAELASLIEHSLFFLGNDSGLMHVAVALNKPCAVFFGPTDERRNGPYEQKSNNSEQKNEGRHLIFRRKDLNYAPCRTTLELGKKPGCIHGDYRCLSDFTLNEGDLKKLYHFVEGSLSPNS